MFPYVPAVPSLLHLPYAAALCVPFLLKGFAIHTKLGVILQLIYFTPTCNQSPNLDCSVAEMSSKSIAAAFSSLFLYKAIEITFSPAFLP